MVATLADASRTHFPILSTSPVVVFVLTTRKIFFKVREQATHLFADVHSNFATSPVD